MACSTDRIMWIMNTKCSLEKEKTYVPFASYPLLQIAEVILPFANKNTGCKITACIVLEIIGFISLPFMLIEVFFKALLCTFVLLGLAIKNALDKDMDNFKTQCLKTGKVLGQNIGMTLILGLLGAVVLNHPNQ